MPVISENYRALNRSLHEKRPDYGAGTVTARWFDSISKLARQLGATSVLDYGCGKGAFARACPHLNVANYDPALPSLSALPSPADFVVCLDVLEHIEPECLDDVLEDLRALSKRLVFLVISCRKAYKEADSIASQACVTACTGTGRRRLGG